MFPIEQGKAEGKAESLQNLMRNLGLTLEKSLDALGIPQEERAKYAAMIQ